MAYKRVSRVILISKQDYKISFLFVIVFTLTVLAGLSINRSAFAYYENCAGTTQGLGIPGGCGTVPQGNIQTFNYNNYKNTTGRLGSIYTANNTPCRHFDIPLQWLSQAGDSGATGAITVAPGTSSANVQYNYTGAHCDSSQDSPGVPGVVNGKFISPLRAVHSNPVASEWELYVNGRTDHPNFSYSIADPGSQLTIYYDSSGTYRFALSKAPTQKEPNPDIGTKLITITWLPTTPPGTYNITFSGESKLVNDYGSAAESPRAYNSRYVCVAGAVPTKSSEGTDCTPSPISVPSELTVKVTIPPPTNQPYIRATNNDVWAGAAFSPNCSIRAGDDAQINTSNLITPSDNTKAHLFAGRMYQALLGSPGDTNGIDYWASQLIDTGSSTSALVGNFIQYITRPASIDHRYTTNTGLGQFPTYVSNNPTQTEINANTAFISQLYKNALGRDPDSGATSWVEKLSKGTPRNDIVASFIKLYDSSDFGLYDGGTYSYGGSGSEYGAFSTGGVLFSDGLTGFTGRNGLPRGLGNLTVNNNLQRFDLMFSNIDNRNIGNTTSGTDYGNFTNIPLCLPDYYGEAIKSPTPQTTEDTSTIANTKKTIIFSGNTINGLDIASGADLTIIKKGDLTINGDITYASKGNLTKPTHFTLIVEGNLNITSGVKLLNGTYVVQPDPTNATNTGTLSTCSDMAPSPTLSDSCNKQLVVNGEVIAQKVLFKRLYGSIGYSNGTTWADSVKDTCLPLNDYNQNNTAGYNYMYGPDGAGQVSKCAAELFKFDPSVYVGAASSNSTTGGGGPEVQSRQELPPIY